MIKSISVVFSYWLVSFTGRKHNCLLNCDFRIDPRINSLLLISPNGGGEDVHGSLDALPSSQQTDGNGHWETLEVYLVCTSILFHEFWLRYFLVLLISASFTKI